MNWCFSIIFTFVHGQLYNIRKCMVFAFLIEKQDDQKLPTNSQHLLDLKFIVKIISNDTIHKAHLSFGLLQNN